MKEGLALSDFEEHLPKPITQLAEHHLRQYRWYKQLLDDYANERARLEDAALKVTTVLDRPAVQSGTVSNPTFAGVARLDALDRQAADAGWYVRCIEAVLESLGPTERDLIELTYFERLDLDTVCQRLGISRSTYYDLRKPIVARLARRLGL